MLATMQRMLHKLTRSRGAPAQAKVIAKLASVRRRHPWAQAVQQLVDGASHGASAAQFPRPEWEAPCRYPPRWSRPVAPSCWRSCNLWRTPTKLQPSCRSEHGDRVGQSCHR